MLVLLLVNNVFLFQFVKKMLKNLEKTVTFMKVCLHIKELINEK
ncbi:hypothetical protein FLJU110815_06720 [Flavobacterium jumunjinense]